MNGVLYFTTPDNVWAIDARFGRQIWHYKRQSEGDHIGHRGVGMYGNWLYFTTPDAHLVSLNAKDGTLRWDIELADPKLGYFSTMAPLVVRNHVIAGVSGDVTDVPGFPLFDSIDPETGKLQWRWKTWNSHRGEPGSETWPKDSDAIRHGGGMTWMTGTYDPDLNLVYWGTGNPNPVLAGDARPGDNLYTCSIVALNADTGKLAWYFQTSPHDVHDWDSVETPVLFDADFSRQAWHCWRRPAATAYSSATLPAGYSSCLCYYTSRMACPFFNPTEAFSWKAWPNPPRMPLGDPYAGVCTAQEGPAPDERLRTCCNTGYARGACPHFPGGDAPDAVRFGIAGRKGGVATIRYVVERDHHPFDDGTIELEEKAHGDDAKLLERQARAFLDSYLRRGDVL